MALSPVLWDYWEQEVSGLTRFMQRHQDHLATRSHLFSVELDHEGTRDRQTSRIATVFELSDELKAVWSGAQLGVEVIRVGPRQGNPIMYQPYRTMGYGVYKWATVYTHKSRLASFQAFSPP
ncbi:MAG: hypothetical protein HC781_01965 [Leptolyngbyaceae cyanobacterium CSU_1_4]|nr:hypothetical protein [Leptolyngbyaceae cyanobacterium CSU_1_4]